MKQTEYRVENQNFKKFLLNLKHNQCSRKYQILKVGVVDKAMGVMVVLVACVKCGILWVLHGHVWLHMISQFYVYFKYFFKKKKDKYMIISFLKIKVSSNFCKIPRICLRSHINFFCLGAFIFKPLWIMRFMTSSLFECKFVLSRCVHCQNILNHRPSRRFQTSKSWL